MEFTQQAIFLRPYLFAVEMVVIIASHLETFTINSRLGGIHTCSLHMVLRILTLQCVQTRPIVFIVISARLQTASSQYAHMHVTKLHVLWLPNSGFNHSPGAS